VESGPRKMPPALRRSAEPSSSLLRRSPRMEPVLTGELCVRVYVRVLRPRTPTLPNRTDRGGTQETRQLSQRLRVVGFCGKSCDRMSGEPCRIRTFGKFTTGQSLKVTCPSPVSESPCGDTTLALPSRAGRGATGQPRRRGKVDERVRSRARQNSSSHRGLPYLRLFWRLIPVDMVHQVVYSGTQEKSCHSDHDEP
jgi:hypothetical protein